MTDLRTILVTGAGAGINAALATHLRAQGHRVIGVDRRDAEIVVDLSTEEGRSEMIRKALELAPDGLDGVVAGAGVSVAEDAGVIVRVNFFGAVATLEGLRPLLLRSPFPRAVAVVSTASLLPASAGTVAACLAADEQRAIQAARAEPTTAYMASKKALAQWIRRQAVTSTWAGHGIALNGVAPGGVRTAMLAGINENPAAQAMLTNTTPKAVRDYAEAEDLAEVIAWLVTARTGYIVGQILFADGGCDAILRPDTF